MTYKQVIVIRDDLKLSAGKIAAQSAHASHAAARKASKQILKEWESSGEKKVVLKADLGKLKELEEKCSKLKIPCALIRDAGLTEVGRGTATALGIGPDDEKRINKVTGSLPLMK